MKKPPPPRSVPTSRVDERDTLFARMSRAPGTPPYLDYYARHPGLEAVDDPLRRMPELMSAGGLFFDPAICAEAEDYFHAIEHISVDPAVVSIQSKLLSASSDRSEALRHLTLELGAIGAGFTAFDRAFVYTHKGRFDHASAVWVAHSPCRALRSPRGRVRQTRDMELAVRD